MLANRTERRLSDQRDIGDLSRNLVPHIANIKSDPKCEWKHSDGPTESFVQSGRILRRYVYSLYERTASKQSHTKR